MQFSFSVAIFALLCSNTFFLEAQSQTLPSITDVLQRHGDLSEFNSLVRESSFLNISSPLTALTVFAPTNEAIRKYRKKLSNETLLFHFTMGAQLTAQLNEGPLTPAFVDSKYQIWITTHPNSSRIFVNDAEIHSRKRNFLLTNSFGFNQTLHVIDRVLEPISFGGGGAGSQVDCPDAKELLRNFAFLPFYEWNKMSERVTLLQKDNLFEAPGGHTFFIPVNKALVTIDMNTVDSAIIDAHVIPNRVLYLRPTLLLQQSGARYATASESATIGLRQDDEDNQKNEDGVIVLSDWRTSTNKSHVQGIIEAEVLQGNIPVSNGVVHLIAKPLGLTTPPAIYELLLKDGGSMKYFSNLLNDYASSELITEIKGRNSAVTIFFPSNAALQQNIDLINDMRSSSRYYEEVMDECLRRHIVLGTVWSANMTQENARNGLITLDPDVRMSFAFDKDSNKFTVNNCFGAANITQPDIVASNGVIHRIDGFLCGNKHTCPTAIDALVEYDDLSEFHDLLKSNLASFLNTLRTVANWTILVPTNSAIQRHRAQGGKISKNTLFYHFIFEGKTTQELEKNVNSPITGGPSGGHTRIWVTKGGSNIFLNDAQIDSQRSNLLLSNSSDMNQIFHVIDRFLEPVRVRYTHNENDDDSYTPPISYPDAFTFISHFKSYNTEVKNHSHTINQWAERISVLKNQDIFQWTGGHTYFIPVDKAFEMIPISDVTSSAIENHIILNHVLFLRSSSSMDILPTQNKTYFKSANSITPLHHIQNYYSKTLKKEYYVVEMTVKDGSLQGVVQAEVVLGNIPIANGVVHLISKPLTYIGNVYKTLKIDKSSAEFYKLFSKYSSPQLKELMYQPRGWRVDFIVREVNGITILVPSNSAMNSKSDMIEIIKNNATLLDDFFRCHFLVGTHLSSKFSTEPRQKSMATNKAKIIFNLKGESSGAYTVGVEGKNATIKIITHDIWANNGAIHLIDGILECAE